MMFSHRSLTRLCFASLAMGLFLTSGCTGKQTFSGNRVVLRVNDQTMTASRFAELLANRLRSYSTLTARDTAVVAQAKKSIAQDFTVQVVTEDWAKKNSIFARKESIDEEIARVRKSYPDEVSFRQALAQDGQTYDAWVERVRFTVLERLVQDELVKNLAPVTKEEALRYYESNKDQFKMPAQVKLRQVVLDSEIAAERVRKEIQSGKSMATLAKKFSITPDAGAGGELGWIEKGIADVFDGAFNMGVGARSGIIKSSYGFHIFEVLNKRPAKTLGFEEARPKIERLLKERGTTRAYKQWLETQVLTAKVFNDDDFIRGIQVSSRSE